MRRGVLRAGGHVAKHFGNLPRSSVRFKKNNETVTRFDGESEAIILRELKKIFPRYSVLSEESGLHGARGGYQWILDPIDGTFNFIMGIPFFSVAVALVKDTTVLAGAIYDPIQKKMYTTAAGQGAFCNGKRIGVSTQASLAHGFITFTHGKSPAIVRRAAKLYTFFRSRHVAFRNPGCVSLQLAAVAQGATDAYIGIDMHSWDYAAGALLVTEAGGTVTEFSGGGWNIESKNIIASNSKLRQTLQKEIRRL